VSGDPLAYLFSLEQFGIKFGLGNITALLDALDHPERSFRSVHVAGTNGKGSVTAMVEAALRAAGHRTGRYTSPHIADLAERFAVNGDPVASEPLLAVIAHVRDTALRLQAGGTLPAPPTFFEVTTAVAFELFRRAGVEVAVCEVGLGGRLDATNVLMPVVTAITSIALDHQQYLGGTLAEIASEKAGIIKPLVPVVVGDVPDPAAKVISAIASQRAAPIVWAHEGTRVRPVSGGSGPTRVDVSTPAQEYGELTIALAGAHQIGNAVVAIRLLEELDGLGIGMSPSQIGQGLATVRWPGRLERVFFPGGREVLLDAAHNPAGAAALASYLREHEKRPLVFAAMRDKDAAGMLQALAPAVSAIVITKASNRRSADPEALAELARTLAPAIAVSVASSPARALAEAWHISPRIVVAGSIFLLGDVTEELRRS
jgi:dihydrofolate synthase/folylpolyglutamate synthase